MLRIIKKKCIIRLFIFTGTQSEVYINQATELLSLSSSTTENHTDGTTVTTTHPCRTGISSIQPINTPSSPRLNNGIRLKYAYDYYDFSAKNAPSPQLQSLENRKIPVTALDNNFSKFVLFQLITKFTS